MSLQPIVTTRLYQQVAGQIAQLIQTKHWGLGERLPAERDMAQRLGVSRPTVREALVALELQGLVEVRTGAGVYVKANIPGPVAIVPDDKDPGPSPFDIIDARMLLEGELAAMAAAKIGPAELGGLEEAIAIMADAVRAGDQQVASVKDGDFLFHSRIAAVSRNTVLQSMVEQLWEGMRRPIFKAISARVRLSKNALRAVQDHRIICDAISSGDPDQAQKAMHRHLEQVKGVMLQNGPP
ncbi:MAG: FadR/GntR family transcriptional regulator [Desulfobacterales bacterium]|jgi:DNA-binding FadR family transcriptional regulator